MITTGAFLAFSIYELASFPLYLRIIFVLLTKSDFKNPFYRLICINGILDVCHCAITILFYRLPMFAPTMGFFPREPSRLISMVIVCYFSLIYQIIFLHVAVSLNRLTGIFAPFKHKTFWEKWWPTMPLFGFLLSIAFTFHRIFSVGQYIPISSSNCGYTPAISRYDFYSFNQNFLTASLGSISLLLCMLINGGTLAKIVQRKRANKNLQQSFKNEIHLFIVSFWMMIFMCVFIAFEIGLWGSLTWMPKLFPTSDETNSSGCFFLSQIPWVEDCFSLSQPWVLILANKSIRWAAFPCANKMQQQQGKTQQKVMVSVVQVRETILTKRGQHCAPSKTT